MKLKKILATGLSTVILASTCLTVSAAPTTAANLTPEEINLIINVEAYKQAYPDLAAAFGDDTEAYINHYLTIGVYEGRTKGVLFDPLTYAEAYGDIRNAFGYDVAALVNHYVACGVAENRVMGTTHGYADIATAESSGLQRYYISRALASEYKNLSAGNSAGIPGSNSLTTTGNYYRKTEILHDDGTLWRTEYYDENNNLIGWSDDTSTNPGNTNSASWDYHRKTEILHDDGTLWRVEYYDENNNFKGWSDVTNTNPDNVNSYTENIYYEGENGELILHRTDTYVDGVLQSSVPGSN